MACFYPVSAWRRVDGAIVFREDRECVSSLFLPCGRCVGCRLERARQWSVRIMHEASLYDVSSFVTLTYEDSQLPPFGSLRYPDFQGFMKRLRHRYGPTRFFMCGEYGSDLGRPHYHVGLFGCGFLEDRKFWRKSETGHRLYRSDSLDRLWGFGFAEFGSLTVQSAGYMARYTLEKITGDLATDHYAVVDSVTGEIGRRVPEFARMSLRPGIGARWLEQHGDYTFTWDHIVVDGVEAKPPRYYDVLYARTNPDRVELVKEERARRAAMGAADMTVERLAVRETVLKSRVSSLKRKMK